MKQLEIKHLAPYLPYGLKSVQSGLPYGINEPLIRDVTMYNAVSFTDDTINAKIVLYPLDYLTKEITHNGETFVPIEHFEIGDDDNYCYEFDIGNIKLIQNLKTIAKYNNWHDINFLPFAVVQQLIEWRFDIFNLINDNLAIPVTEDFNPYK